MTGNSATSPAEDFVGTKDKEPLIIRTSDVERLRVDPDGNVGIGTAEPGAQLVVGHKYGAALSGGMSGCGIFGNNLATHDSGQDLYTVSDSDSAGFAAIRARWGKLEFFASGGKTTAGQDVTSAAPRLTIDNNGDVGIGTTTPGAKLEVNTGGQDRPALCVTGKGPIWGACLEFNDFGTNGKKYFACSRGGQFTLGDNQESQLQINPNWDTILAPYIGNVGIGNGSPDRPLTIQARGLGEELVSFKDPSGVTRWHINENLGGSHPGLNFAETGVADARLFLKAGGNVGIGTDAPISALHVVGDLNVTGDVFLPGGDCAEHFDVVGDQPEPGTVVVIEERGALRESNDAYDRKVAGVVSGAGEYKHAIVLDTRPAEGNRAAVALMGKVYCKVDTAYSPIQVGDLLTTSPTPGHAMKAMEPVKAFGAVLGKALKPFDGGRGLIPILIALQ